METQTALEQRLEQGVDPVSASVALFFLAVGAQLSGDERRLAALVTRAQALVDALHTLPGAGPHGVLQGWSLCQAGQVHAGLERMRDSLQSYRAQGSVAGRTLLEQMHARQLLHAGEHAQAAQALQRCEELNAMGTNLGWGEALRTRAACLARLGSERQQVLRALDEAEAYARERGLARLLQQVQMDRERLG